MPNHDPPLHFTIPFTDVDLSLLPSHAREVGSVAFKSALAELLARDYGPLGGSLAVSFADDAVCADWTSDAQFPDLVGHAIKLLQKGEYAPAISLLDAIVRADPDDVGARYNLGMALSDRGRLGEAKEHLQAVLDRVPSHGDALVALGVAFQRDGDQATARRHLARAVEVDPDNGYAHRNLAALFGNAGMLREAEFHFRAALRLLPRDQRTVFGLARCLDQQGSADREAEADALYGEVISLDPSSEIAEQARRARSAIAQRNLRGGHRVERMDAVMYCLSAMQVFDKMSPTEVHGVTLEIALLGRRGLDINDPTPKYYLKSLPGQFSGLNLTCLMYVGFKRIAPTMDAGIDLSAEYAAALRLHEDAEGVG